ncbi:MAG: DNA translocase FtsK [Caldilineaceae bacterium]|nr:DNA translocase FtsK [Caldilineaceae bacterium]
MIAMPQEAQIINRLFHQHKVQCRVLPPPASYQTATLRLFRLQRGTGVPVNKVTGLADELDEALTHLRRRPVQVRFDRLPLRLEVPRPDPQVLRLQGVLERLPPEHFEEGRLLAVIGEGHAYGQSQMILLDLIGPNAPHLLLAGTTGSGKTNLLAGLILSLAHLNSPRDLALVLLDPKGVDLQGFSVLPHLATPLITDPVEAVDALRSVVAELEKRKQVAGSRWQVANGQQPTSNGFPRLVVAIDELAELMDVAGSEVEASVKRILQVGRGLGIHMIAATQKPLVSVIGSLVKANFPVRLVGKVASGDDAKVAAGLPGTDAERLPGLGAFLLVQGGEIQRVQSYHLPQPDLPRLSASVRDGWQGTATTWRLPQRQPTPQSTAAIAQSQSNGGYPHWLRKAVEAYLADHERLPSQRAVQRTYQDETGQMLAWETIRQVIEDVGGQQRE